MKIKDIRSLSQHTKKLISQKRKQFFLNNPEAKESMKTRHSVKCKKCGSIFKCATTNKNLCDNCKQNWKECKICKQQFVAKPYQSTCNNCLNSHTCACGCGEKIAINKTYKNGHNSFKTQITIDNCSVCGEIIKFRKNKKQLLVCEKCLKKENSV